MPRGSTRQTLCEKRSGNGRELKSSSASAMAVECSSKHCFLEVGNLKADRMGRCRRLRGVRDCSALGVSQRHILRALTVSMTSLGLCRRQKCVTTYQRRRREQGNHETNQRQVKDSVGGYAVRASTVSRESKVGVVLAL